MSLGFGSIASSPIGSSSTTGGILSIPVMDILGAGTLGSFPSSEVFGYTYGSTFIIPNSYISDNTFVFVNVDQALVTQEYAELLFKPSTTAVANTQEYAEVLYALSQPNVTVTSQWVEALQNSTTVPNVTVTSQWVEALQNSTTVPNVTVTSQWVEYIVSAAAPVFVEVTSQWVEYIAKMPNYARVTQEYAETLTKPTSVSAAVTEEYAEILSIPQNPVVAVSQEYVESISERINNAFSTLVYCETIGNVWVSLFPARVTELYSEIISATGVNTRIHNSSVYSEIIRLTDISERVTTTYTDIHYKPSIVNASVSQQFVEIISRAKGSSISININAN